MRSRKKDGVQVGPDGESNPIYEPLVGPAELEKEFQSARVQVELDALEKEGRIMKNGMHRPASDGRLQPVYVAVKGVKKH